MTRLLIFTRQKPTHLSPWTSNREWIKMARSSGVLANPEDGGAYTFSPRYRHLIRVSRLITTDDKGTPKFIVATRRFLKLTSSHRLVCWQFVNGATTSSSPWWSWAGGTNIHLTHQGSSSCCAPPWLEIETRLDPIVVSDQAYASEKKMTLW